MDPRKMSNDAMAASIELWAKLDEHLTTAQLAFFDEIVWRLRLMSDKKKENTNG